jgi:hypothetical protein
MEQKPEREKEVIEEADAELDPFEINFLPQFMDNRGPRKPFINQYDVVIGDHNYESEQSPLMNWSLDTDPSIMSGDEWVHPFKDIGFHTAENKDYFEKGIMPQGGIYMHPDKDVAYEAFNLETGGALPNEYTSGAISNEEEMSAKPRMDKESLDTGNNESQL